LIAGYVPQPRCLPSNIARLGAQGPLLQPVKKALDQSIVHIFRRNVTSTKAMRLKNPAAFFLIAANAIKRFGINAIVLLLIVNLVQRLVS
jgi:hypothetical protein